MGMLPVHFSIKRTPVRRTALRKRPLATSSCIFLCCVLVLRVLHGLDRASFVARRPPAAIPKAPAGIEGKGLQGPAHRGRILLSCASGEEKQNGGGSIHAIFDAVYAAVFGTASRPEHGAENQDCAQDKAKDSADALLASISAIKDSAYVALFGPGTPTRTEETLGLPKGHVDSTPSELEVAHNSYAPLLGNQAAQVSDAATVDIRSQEHQAADCQESVDLAASVSVASSVGGGAGVLQADGSASVPAMVMAAGSPSRFEIGEDREAEGLEQEYAQRFDALEQPQQQLIAQIDEEAANAPQVCNGQLVECSDEDGPCTSVRDFFLFIKGYDWSLRYRVSRLADSMLDVEKPLDMEWVKLRKPIENPSELFKTSETQELFDWDVTAPPSHSGFMYHVTRVVGSGVEAVINFFEGRGISLLVEPDTGIQLTGDGSRADKDGRPVKDTPLPVTHCWVQVMGMPFLPILQSIAFFNVQEVVIDYHA